MAAQMYATNCFLAGLTAFLIVFYLKWIHMPKYQSSEEDEYPIFRNSEDVEKPILHLCTFISGRDDYLRVETLIKSILLLHKSNQQELHYHFVADNLSRHVLSSLLQTWQIDSFRWSIYDAADDVDRMGWIRSSRPGSFQQLQLMLDEKLPGYVDKVILIDSDVLLLSDVGNLEQHFETMRKRGASMGMESSQPRIGITLFDLDKMRDARWRNAWHAEAARLVKKNFSPGEFPTEQEILSSLARSRPGLFTTLPIANGTAIKVPLRSSSSEERKDYGSRLESCLTAMDGSVFETPLKNHSYAVPRTLELLNPLESGKAVDDVTLLLQLPVARVMQQAALTSNWPGQVIITAFGRDDEREQLMRDLAGLSRPVAVHYMYQTVKTVSYPLEHMRKLSIDSVKTPNVLLIDQLDRIDYSRNLHSLVRPRLNDTDMRVIQVADQTRPVGAVLSKMMAQRVHAAARDYDWAEIHLKLNRSVIYVKPSEGNYQESDIKEVRTSLRNDHWCAKQLNLLKRSSLDAKN